MEGNNKFNQASATFLGLAEYHNIAQEELETQSNDQVDAMDQELLNAMRELQSNIQELCEQIDEVTLESRRLNMSLLLDKVVDFVMQLEYFVGYIEQNTETIPAAMVTPTNIHQENAIVLFTNNPQLTYSLIQCLVDIISIIALFSQSQTVNNINWNEVLQKMNDTDTDCPLNCLRSCLQLIRSAVTEE